jgi:hypothetical protein
MATREEILVEIKNIETVLSHFFNSVNGHIVLTNRTWSRISSIFLRATC